MNEYIIVYTGRDPNPNNHVYFKGEGYGLTWTWYKHQAQKFDTYQLAMNKLEEYISDNTYYGWAIRENFLVVVVVDPDDKCNRNYDRAMNIIQQI